MYAFHHDRSHRNYPRRVWRETMRCLRAKVSAVAHAIGAQLWAPLAQIAATTQCKLAIARTRATVIVSEPRKSLAACIGRRIRPFASAVCYLLLLLLLLLLKKIIMLLSCPCTCRGNSEVDCPVHVCQTQTPLEKVCKDSSVPSLHLRGSIEPFSGGRGNRC